MNSQRVQSINSNPLDPQRLSVIIALHLIDEQLDKFAIEALKLFSNVKNNGYKTLD